MNTYIYNKFLTEISELKPNQIRNLKNKIEVHESKKIVAKTLETPSNKIFCAHCKSKSFYKWGIQNDLQRYKCKECNKTFNSLSGTPLAKLKRKGHWLEYSSCLKNGFSIRKSAQICGISQTTSFRWRHRFLKGQNLFEPHNIKGIIEIDNFKIKRSFKGAKNIPDFIRNKTVLINIIIGRDRYGNTIDFKQQNFNHIKLSEKFSKVLSKDILFCSDKKPEYFDFSQLTKFKQGYIDRANKIKIKKNVVHLNNIEDYSIRFFKWMTRFYGVATKYLKNYLSWYRLLDEKQMQPCIMLLLIRSKSNKINFSTLDENIYYRPIQNHIEPK